MQRRRIGSSGLSVSLVGLGCNNFGSRTDMEGARKVVNRALDVGIDFFDTADIYSEGESERILGGLLAGKRADVVLATKVGHLAKPGAGGSRRYVMQAVEKSLARLKTDWIDLLYMHASDPNTPIEETLRTLDDLVRQGKVRYIANSNYAGWEVAAADWAARHFKLEKFIGCQDEYNLLERRAEKELLPAIRAHGLGLIPYFPLAGGFLTGKYKPDAMPAGARLTESAHFAKRHRITEQWNKVAQLEAFAKARGHEVTELAFSWLASHPEIPSIIAGATRPDQVEQNAKAADWAMTSADLEEVDRILKEA